MTSIVSISGGGARQNLASAGGAPFHTLNLRESSKQKEKAITHRINEQSRKRQNMKELLVQNYLKRYMNRIEPGTANNVLIARVISIEVENFMERERGQGMNQKALKELEKEIESKLKQDPRLQLFDIPIRQSIQEGGFPLKRDLS